jgi:outer membrane lipoprotein carrier protein
MSVPILSQVSVMANETSLETPPKITLAEVPQVLSEVTAKKQITSPLDNVLIMKNDQDKKNLMLKLAQFDFFSANFTQKILSESGELLQQGSGTIAISKPNLVNWQTIEPDETSLISDGETIWSYDPFIEQASAYSLDNVIDNTPVLLLTTNDESLWEKYSVEQRDDEFIIKPLIQDSQIKSLRLRFSASDKMQLSEFSFKDATGQTSRIELSEFNAIDKPAATLFEFIVPEGVRLEDER